MEEIEIGLIEKKNGSKRIKSMLNPRLDRRRASK